MNRIGSTLYLLLAILIMGCGQNIEVKDEEAATIPRDTATASSAPVIVEEQDTTLQPVVELQITALGNTEEEIRYDTDTLEARAGAKVKLVFTNEAQDMPMMHNVVFTMPDKYKLVALAGANVGAPGNYVPESEQVIAATPLALPGQTVEIEFKAPMEPGAYNFVCTYPGHWQRMNGVFLVK
ncbi:MAG: plastocyanin/azurin family copper-binding protein [Hymenobacteraceae bacterium]|nr:plastocyanin/azurin family copper-binding protein [Hymenobacteraceae bacterium]